MYRYNLNLSDKTRGVMADLAERLDIPLAEVIREALSLLWWLARELSEGNRLLVQRGDRITEVEFPSLDKLRPLREQAKEK